MTRIYFHKITDLSQLERKFIALLLAATCSRHPQRIPRSRGQAAGRRNKNPQRLFKNKWPIYLLFCLSFFFLKSALCAPLHLVIHGVNKEIEENIRSNLTHLAVEEEFGDNPASKAEYQKWIEQEILVSLQPFGYYEPHVKTDLIFKGGAWHANFDIRLGEPIRVESLHFVLEGPGKGDPKLAALFLLFPLKKGDIFVHPIYDQGKKALLSKTMQNGYLKAQFSSHRVEVDIENHTSQIYLTLATGPRHYFSETTFTGQTKLSEKFLRRYLPYEFGEVYTPEKALLLQSRFLQNDYFSQVNVRPVPNDNDIAVPMVVELVEAKPNQYQIGAGYGTDTGIRGKLGWTRRRLNASGHQLSTQAIVSEIFKKGQVDYIIPGKRPYSDETRISGALFEDEYSEKPSTIYEVGVSESREVHGWERQIALFYRHESFKAFSTLENEQAKLLLPSIVFIKTERDDNLRPRHGKKLEISLRGALDVLFSDANFVQAYIQYRQLNAIRKNTKLLFRTELGATLPTNVDILPPSQRFFAGGDTSLRGYAYRSLPTEVDKDGILRPVGGAYLAVGSIEVIQQVKGPVGVFAFVDAGNAFRPASNDPIEVGTGAGIEWSTKLGPIKVALAKPLNKDSDAWRIHASFGPEL